MGYKELIEALRSEGEEKVRSIRKDAEAEAEAIRKEARREILRLTEESRRTQSGVVDEQNEAVLSEAGKKAKMILKSAEKELADRLYSSAMRSLSALRGEGYPDVFDSLVRELPPYRWEVVRVNPDDAEKAKGYFRDAEIIPDSTITAGLDVMKKDGKIRVVNTFEQRLENIWGEVLPGLMKDVYGRIAANGNPERD